LFKSLSNEAWSQPRFGPPAHNRERVNGAQSRVPIYVELEDWTEFGPNMIERLNALKFFQDRLGPKFHSL
jgi:hypothetical protein